VSSMTDKSRGVELAAESEKVLREASKHAAAAVSVVEKNINT